MARREEAPKPLRPVGDDDVGHGPLIDVTVVMLEAGYASTAIAPIEVFHSAGVLWPWLRGEETRPHFRVKTASLDGGSVTSLCQVGLTPQCGIEDIERTDVVILPACGWNLMDQIACSTPLLPWLRDQYERGAYIAGICSGVGFLAQCGLLDGRQATTHWALADTYRERYPQVRWRPEHFVTEDGRVLCSGGVYASIDLSLYLVEKFCGREVAIECAKALLVGMPRAKQSGYAVLPLSRPHFDDRIKQAEEYLQANYTGDVSFEAIAERVGMGPRNFIRRFKAATGRLPGAYLQMLRVSAAKALLEQGAASVQTVASKIGYEDIAHFRSLFKRHTGMTPAEYRLRFGQRMADRGELVAGWHPTRSVQEDERVSARR